MSSWMRPKSSRASCSDGPGGNRRAGGRRTAAWDRANHARTTALRFWPGNQHREELTYRRSGTSVRCAREPRHGPAQLLQTPTCARPGRSARPRSAAPAVPAGCGLPLRGARIAALVRALLARRSWPDCTTLPDQLPARQPLRTIKPSSSARLLLWRPQSTLRHGYGSMVRRSGSTASRPCEQIQVPAAATTSNVSRGASACSPSRRCWR